MLTKALLLPREERRQKAGLPASVGAETRRGIRVPAASLFGRSQDFSTESASPTVNQQEAAVGASATAGLQADLVVCQDPGSTEELGQVHRLPSFLAWPVLPSLKESLLWTGFLCLPRARRPPGAPARLYSGSQRNLHRPLRYKMRTTESVQRSQAGPAVREVHLLGIRNGVLECAPK